LKAKQATTISDSSEQLESKDTESEVKSKKKSKKVTKEEDKHISKKSKKMESVSIEKKEEMNETQTEDKENRDIILKKKKTKKHKKQEAPDEIKSADITKVSSKGTGEIISPPLSLVNKNKRKGFKKEMLEKSAQHIKFAEGKTKVTQEKENIKEVREVDFVTKNPMTQ
jgi:hypothetical protein